MTANTGQTIILTDILFKVADTVATGVQFPVLDCPDCSGEVNGTAQIDNCGVCSGGTTGIVPNTACDRDCNGYWNGTAYTDTCGKCVSGTTGLTPCSRDCNGVLGGMAFVDNCGDCVGGTTGRDVCAIQRLSLRQGWNLVSLYVQPQNSSVLAVFPNATQLKTMDNFWDATHAEYQDGFDTLVADRGYMLHNSTTELLVVKGAFVAESSHESTFATNGWLLLPIVKTALITDYFGSALDSIQVIKDFDSFWLPDGSGSLKVLDAGKAYWVK